MSSHFLFCEQLRWSLQYGRCWLQFPNDRCSIQSYFSDKCSKYSKKPILIANIPFPQEVHFLLFSLVIPAYPTNKYYQKSKEQKWRVMTNSNNKCNNKCKEIGRLPNWSIQSKRFYLPDFLVILEFLVVPEILYYPSIKNKYNLLL